MLPSASSRLAGIASVILAFASAPASAQESAPGTQSGAPLDVDASIALALDANPTLRAALFDAVASRADARAVQAARHPTLTASSQGQYTETIGGTASGAIRTRAYSVVSSAGLSFTTPAGTVLSLTLGSTTQWRQAGLTPGVTTVVTIGPTYSGTATVTARQPLLRGRGREAVLAEQRQAEARADSSEASAMVATSQLVHDVLAAYWELWYAQRAATVQHDAVTLAAEQARVAVQQRTLGTIAPADVLQFVAAEASLREQAASADATRIARAVAFARTLGLATNESANLAIGVAEPGVGSAPDVELLVRHLREDSPRIQALEADVEAARAATAMARNASRPRLDATGSAGVAGLWMDDVYQGLSLPGGRPAVVASVGVELELPVVAERARAQRAAAAAELDAAEARLAAAVAELEAAVTAKVAELRSAVARAELTTETARVADQLAEAERARLGLGTSTPAVLLDAQQSARESRLRHDRALVDAQITAADLDHEAGILLDRFQIVAPPGASE